MRSLFWIASTNFVFPGEHAFWPPSPLSNLIFSFSVILNIIQIALCHVPTSDYIQVTNPFVSAFCAVLATGALHINQTNPIILTVFVVWSSTSSYRRTPQPSTTGSRSLKFAPRSEESSFPSGLDSDSQTSKPENGWHSSCAPAAADAPIPLNVRIDKETQQSDMV
jgi:hypothetical protein